MIVIKSSWFPFGDYDAMALFPFVFVKGEVPNRVIRHEQIHLEQQKELLIIGFLFLYVVFFVSWFLWYFIFEWRVTIKQAWNEAYKRNPFEAEAYDNEWDEYYLEKRELFNWVNYL